MLNIESGHVEKDMILIGVAQAVAIRVIIKSMMVKGKNKVFEEGLTVLLIIDGKKDEVINIFNGEEAE